MTATTIIVILVLVIFLCLLVGEVVKQSNLIRVLMSELEDALREISKLKRHS